MAWTKAGVVGIERSGWHKSRLTESKDRLWGEWNGGKGRDMSDIGVCEDA